MSARPSPTWCRCCCRAERALVSTATKSLQDQLFLRDLPRLREALGVPVQLALLKGRSSYLCLQRLEQARQGGRASLLPDRLAVRALARVETWAQATRSGDLAELDGLDERSPVIPLVTSTRENCLGSECPQFKACHVMQARREAMAADMVVVNHHLFFADMALRDSGVAELLPTVDAAVFDEAHQLVEAGVQFLGTTLGTAQLIDFARDLLAMGLQQARGLRDWQAGRRAGTGRARAAAAVAGALRELRGMRQAALGRAQRVAGLRRRACSVGRGLRRRRPRRWPRCMASGPDFVKLHERRHGPGATGAAFRRHGRRGPCALDRRHAAAGAAGRVAAGHPRHA